MIAYNLPQYIRGHNEVLFSYQSAPPSLPAVQTVAPFPDPDAGLRKREGERERER